MSSDEEEYESVDFDSNDESVSDIETGNNREFKNGNINFGTTRDGTRVFNNHG